MEEATKANNNHKRKKLLEIAAGIFLAIGIIYMLYWLIFGRFEEYTDDAYVQGNIVQLMSEVPGTIVSIATDDTFLVKQNQVLVTLGHNELLQAYDRAAASLASTVRQTAELYQNVGELRATLALNQADLLKAQQDLARRQGLVAAQAISNEEFQHAKTAVATAAAQVTLTQHQLDTAITLVNNTTLYHYPAVETAKANLRTAYLNLVRTKIVAPVTGYIAKRSAQLGQQINPGTPLMAIVPLNQIWVDANFKESQLANIRIGQTVTLYSDVYGNAVKYKGTVLGLGAGTGSVFSLLPPENATGNWIKIVQRLPVRIAIDPNQLSQYPLRLGLSMRVTVNTHDRTGPMLASAVEPKVIYQTSVYEEQIAPVEAIINNIIRANASDVAFTTSTAKPVKK